MAGKPCCNRPLALNAQKIYPTIKLEMRMKKLSERHKRRFLATLQPMPGDIIVRSTTQTPEFVLRNGIWWCETKDKAIFRVVCRTWKHKVRCWIGLTGYLGDGEYCFKRVKFRGRLHRFLNWFLKE